MTRRSRKKTEGRPTRGEIWWIRFDPSEGAEIGKVRPAVVVSIPSVGRLPLRIVVPITDWQQKWATVLWLVYLKKTKRNGLKKDSAADCFQVKSVSLKRFESLSGRLTADELEQISVGVALCVGAPSRDRPTAGSQPKHRAGAHRPLQAAGIPGNRDD